MWYNSLIFSYKTEDTKDKRTEKKMKKIIRMLCLFVLLVIGVLTGCGRLSELQDLATTPAPVVVERGEMITQEQQTGGDGSETEAELQTEEITIDTEPERVPVKAKGVYISSYVAGTPSMVDNLITSVLTSVRSISVIRLSTMDGVPAT